MDSKAVSKRCARRLDLDEERGIWASGNGVHACMRAAASLTGRLLLAKLVLGQQVEAHHLLVNVDRKLVLRVWGETTCGKGASKATKWMFNRKHELAVLKPAKGMGGASGSGLTSMPWMYKSWRTER